MSVKSDLAERLLVPLWRLRARALGRRAESRILMYHAIGSAVPEDAQGRYNISPHSFERQMARLANSGLPVVSTPGAPGGVAITFDDGYRDNLTHALPVLARYGLPCTIFVAAGFVRSGNSLYLSAAELKVLAAHPLVNIGAHGDSHSRLTDLNDADLAAELAGAKLWLEETTGKPVTSLSYPHGAVDGRVRAAVAANGFTCACTSEFGVNEVGRDALALRRIDIWSTDDELTFQAKLAGDWDWMRFFTRCGL